MNRAINVILLVILFPTMLISIYVGMDLPITFLKTTGEFLPYKSEIFLGLGLLILLLLLRRTVRRWMGMRIVSQKKKFKWNQEVSRSRKKRIITYLGLEAVAMFSVGYAIYSVSPEAWAPALALIFGVVDSLLFALVGSLKKGFRVGLSSKALIVADREVTLLYFTGLRKVSPHQQSVYFDYVKDLQLSFPIDCIQKNKLEEFYTALEEQMNPDKVYFSWKK